MSRRRKGLIYLGGAALAAVSLYFLFRTQPIIIDAVEVRRGRVEATVSTTAAGTIDAEAVASLTPDYPGRITGIPVKEGDRLKKGDVILEMDNDEQKLSLRKAEREYDRVNHLHDKGLASAQQWEMARDAREAARIAYEKTLLRAPFNGLLARLDAVIGERVGTSLPVSQGLLGTSSSALAVLVDDSRMYVKAEADEVDAGRLKVGQPVRIALDAYPGQKFTGTLSDITPLVSTTLEQNRTVPIKISLPVRPEFTVGMSADVEIIVDSRDDVLYLPTNAVLEKDHEKYVYIANGHRAKRVSVSTGITNWDLTEITSGLADRALVIIPTDEKKLAAGARIRLKPPGGRT